MTIEEMIGDKLRDEIMSKINDDNIVTIDVEAEIVQEDDGSKDRDEPEGVIEVVPEKGKEKDYRKLFEKIRALRRRINPDIDTQIELEEIGEGVKVLGKALKTIFGV